MPFRSKRQKRLLHEKMMEFWNEEESDDEKIDEERCFCYDCRGERLGVGEKPAKCVGFGMLPCPNAQ